MRITKVIDTRHYEEINDKWYPIPGSGEDNICSRCGKSHEVHFYVEVDGKTEIVGGGCAKQAGMISESQNKSLGSAAVTLAKNKSELAQLLDRKKLQEEIWGKVDSLPLPEIVPGAWELSPYAFSGQTRDDSIWKMGEAEVRIIRIFSDNLEMKSWNISENTQREQSGKIHLIAQWKANRFKELAPVGFKQIQNFQIDECRKRVKRAEKKIQILMEGSK